MDDTNIIEIPEFFGYKIKTRYIIDADGIIVHSASNSKRDLFIAATSINAFRLGVKFARGYRFYIGRKYWMEIRYEEDKILKISLSSYYGIKAKTYDEAWRSIFNLIWHHYAPEVLNKYINAFNEKKEFEMAGFNFETDGLRLNKDTKLLWKELSMSKYRSYFMIYQKGNPKIHRSCTFAIDWNAYVAQDLFEKIINENTKSTD